MDDTRATDGEAARRLLKHASLGAKNEVVVEHHKTEVAIIGGRGQLGRYVTQYFGYVDQSRRINTTILKRKESYNFYTGFPNMKVVEVDFSSVESISNALKGVEVLIDLSWTTDASYPARLTDACIAAGVRRIIPTSFCLDPRVEVPFESPVFKVKKAAYEDARAKQDMLEWTTLSIGDLMDFTIQQAIGKLPQSSQRCQESCPDWKPEPVDMVEKGEHVIPFTTQSDVNKALVAIVSNLDKTKNREVFVASVYISRSRLAEVVLKGLWKGWDHANEAYEDTGDEHYEETVESWRDTMSLAGNDIWYAFETLQMSDVEGYEPEKWHVRRAMMDERLIGQWGADDNELCGIAMMSDEDVVDFIVNRYFA